MDKKFFVKVSDINDDNIILRLLEFGSIDHVTKHTNIFTMTMDSKNEENIKLCEGVLGVRESQSGKWLKG